MTRTSLVVQWLRLRAPDAGDPGSKPGQGTSSHMPQLKIQHSHTSKYLKKKKKKERKERGMATPAASIQYCTRSCIQGIRQEERKERKEGGKKEKKGKEKATRLERKAISTCG